MLSRFISLVLLLGWALSAAAQPSELAEPRFESVGNANTIPQSIVSALAQDRAGFLWIGTGTGLVRYDGYSFRPQKQEGAAGKTAQSLGFIRALLVARNGLLWIGTESDGLAAYDPATEKLTLYRPDAGNAAAVAAGTLRALAEDRDGGLWVGSIGHGLNRYDPATAQFQHWRAGTESGLLDDRVQALLADRSGALWVGSWQGLSRREAGATRFEPVFSSPGAAAGNLAGKIITTLFEAADGQVWAGTQQGDLALIDPRSGQGRLLAGGADHGSVYAFMEPGTGPQAAAAGEVWIGRAGGIEVRAMADGRLLRHLRHNPRNAASLAGNEVRALLRDRAGWVWAGGYGGGLQRHNPANRSIWVRQPDTEGPFQDANVRSVLQLDNEEIWLGTTENGVTIMDAQLRAIGRLAPQPGAAGQASGRVSGLAQTKDGSIWLGSAVGVQQFDRQRKLLRTLPAGQGRVRRLLAGSDGSLWIATQDGLFRLPPGAGAAMQRLQARGGLPVSGDINALTEAADGSLWVGTEKGLYVLAAGAAEMQAVAMRPGQELVHPSIVGLLIDAQARLWVDTASGLNRLLDWDGKTAAFERISERHGFVGRAFGANLLSDARGRIWSQQFVYDPASDRLDELTPADGVDFGTGWFRAYAKTRDGRLLFGGSKGLLVVTPEAFDGWRYAPPLVVSELRIDGQRQPAERIKDGLILNPEQRSFSLEFAALDFSDPGRSRYSYRLEGLDADWIGTGADFRVASYANLPPGDYQLRVRATNRSGLWSPHELSMGLRVLPAWWQSWWCRAFGLAMLAGLFYAAVQLRTGYLRRRQRVLEARVSERTAELEALSRALEQSSLTDPLTGLRNRRFLSQHIEPDVALSLRQHEDAQRAGVPPPPDADLIFFLVDVDHFKSVNDEHGHAAGDAVLVQMRARLQAVFREADYLVRWGGEEFLIVARGTARAHAPELAERARAAVAEQPFVLDTGAVLRRSCSVGFACYPLAPATPRALDWAALIGLADGALYAAKAAGRNAWVGVLGVRAGVDLAALQAQPRRALDPQQNDEDSPLQLVRSASAGVQIL